MKGGLKFLGLLGLVLALAARPTEAQGKQSLILNAPFSFMVEQQSMPAGAYRIVVEHGWLQIRSLDRQTAAAVLTLPVSGRTPEGVGQVVFDRLAGRYFLSQVWVPGMETGRQALESREERELKRREKLEAVVIKLDGQTSR
jgi:hypothetical protein